MNFVIPVRPKKNTIINRIAVNNEDMEKLELNNILYAFFSAA